MNAICIDVAERVRRSHHNAIDKWFQQVHGINGQFAQAIWQLYLDQLVNIARGKLGSLPQKDGEIAGTALVSFARGTQAGRFPQLADRHDLWRLLVSMTVRRLTTHIQGEIDCENIDTTVLEAVLSDGPSEELASELLNTCSESLQCLRDPASKVLALFKMESYTEIEIALILGCPAHIVHRGLEQIRDTWKERETQALLLGSRD